MLVNRKELKRKSKEIMHATRPRPVLVALVLVAILAVLDILTLIIDGEWAVYMSVLGSAVNGTELTELTIEGASGFGSILTFAMELIGIELSTGFLLYALRVYRQEGASFGDMFDSFGMFFRVIWIYVVPSMLITLWSLIYIIPAAGLMVVTDSFWALIVCLPLALPAVRAAYSYRQATYLVLENPNMTCMQCIRRSKDMMDGRRWELFKLDVSFIGWYLLCIVPFVALWVLPYTYVVDAGFFVALEQDYAEKCPTPVMPTEPPMV